MVPSRSAVQSESTQTIGFKMASAILVEFIRLTCVNIQSLFKIE